MLVMITSLYAAILAVIFFALFSTVGRLRGKLDLSLGDGGNADLIVANRRHMNFVENVPMALLLISIVEVNGASVMWVHALGATLVVSRIIHPFGIRVDKMATPARIAGAALTVFVILASAVTLLWQFFRG